MAFSSRAGSLVRIAVAGLVCTSAPLFGQGKSAAGDKLFGLTSVHKIHLSLSAAEWSVLQTSQPRNGGGPNGTDYALPDGRMVHVGSGFGGYFPWTRADVRVDDPELKAAFKDAGLRYKGNLTFQSSSGAAPLFANFKLKIDQHGGKGTWDGEKTFNLSAGVVDTSKMREAIAFAIFRAAGVPAPRTTYAELFFTVPGLYQDTSAGLFTVIEDVNKKFLERVLPPGTGLLMKPEGLRGGVHDLGDTWSAYTSTYRPDRDATPHEQQRVIAFAKLVSQTDVGLFRSKIGSYLDVDEFLRFIAVNALIANNDSYLGGSHNYYIYLDPKDDKFRFLPWDEDLSMASRGGMFVGALQIVRTVNGVTTTTTAPGATTATGAQDVMQPWRGDNGLTYWLLDDPAVAARYRTIVSDIADKVFNNAELTKMVDALEKVTENRGNSPRSFLEGRAAAVKQMIAGWK